MTKPPFVPQLPEFKLSITRVPPGETALPWDSEDLYVNHAGQRSKFGGKPDFNQWTAGDIPDCPICFREMTFVAQIDSLEHESATNPNSVDVFAGNQKWMFTSNVGMILVFYCFLCNEVHAGID